MIAHIPVGLVIGIQINVDLCAHESTPLVRVRRRLMGTPCDEVKGCVGVVDGCVDVGHVVHVVGRNQCR